MAKKSASYKVNKKDIDNIVTYFFLKKITTPPQKMEAYSLGLIDRTGRVLRKPVTEDEKLSLTLLDRLVLKMRRLLGSRMSILNNFVYLQTTSPDFYSNIKVVGNISKRSEITRIKKSAKSYLESENITADELIRILLSEETEETDFTDLTSINEQTKTLFKKVID